ncbi:type IV toxin-antitoxin system AbiEi family antitoxin domain-containing protein [Spiractinospora alimapuensis]|uniref:type IV toxin-antitoxin system AbiEi family antitoxin domain-containing protein n=1 Tax=Spiractinospora alimapuensis TaxID=2820884 RepID=UPI001F2A4D29|nr:type IV toxin-antitoxin system AbiEi family antitoxin domain-containing protein [Spiractinospora alimapuensis]QVQ51747.1 type IV toxin-antitoxin system AbiEi family antitoxin domain-containing protein [Spiractinospora alimapuensis]
MANHKHLEAAEKLAGQQHGVVSREQAVAHGMSIPQIGYRLKRGYWLSVHHGVYRIRRMTANTERGRLHSAVKAGQLIAGPAAVAVGETAARLWGLQGLPPWRGEVVLAGKRSKTYAGARVRLHSWSIEENEIQRRNGVRITTIRRTLRDLMSTQGRDIAVSLVDSALNRQAVRGEHLLREVSATGGRQPDGRLRRSW